MKPKVLIPYHNYYGGPGTFIEQLTSNNKGFSFTNVLSKKVDIILVIVYYNPLKLFLYKRFYNIKIVLRLDGITKYSKPTFKQLFKALLLYESTKIIYKFLADYVILQSHYVKQDVLSTLGKTSKQNSIIYNGVCFNNESHHYDRKSELKIVYWASSISKDCAFLLSKIADGLQQQSTYNKIHVYGRLSNWDIKIKTSDYPNVNFYGEVSRREIHHIAENYDVFLMIKGSASPNSLVECLAHNLIVVGFNEMGNSEIIDDKCGVLFKRNSDINYNVKQFIEGIQTIQANMNTYQLNIKMRYEKMFTCEIMKQNYGTIFNSLLE